jgi:hypothetical protein
MARRTAGVHTPKLVPQLPSGQQGRGTEKPSTSRCAAQVEPTVDRSPSAAMAEAAVCCLGDTAT